MEITIRPARISDSADIGKYLFTRVQKGEVKRNLEKDIQKMNRGELLRIVAEIDGKVLGQCDFRRSTSPIKQHMVEVTSLAVNSKYQGRGIGSKLIQYGFRWAKEHGINIVIASVRKGAKAKSVYIHQGFAVYGELKDGIKEPWGENKIYNEIFLAKNLD